MKSSIVTYEDLLQEVQSMDELSLWNTHLTEYKNKTRVFKYELENFEKHFIDGENVLNKLAYHTTGQVAALDIIENKMFKGFCEPELLARQLEVNSQIQSTIKRLKKQSKLNKEKIKEKEEKLHYLTKLLDPYSDQRKLWLSDDIKYMYNFSSFLLGKGLHSLSFVYRVEGLDYIRNRLYEDSYNTYYIIQEGLHDDVLEYLRTKRFDVIGHNYTDEIVFFGDLPYNERVERIYINSNNEMKSIYQSIGNDKYIRFSDFESTDAEEMIEEYKRILEEGL